MGLAIGLVFFTNFI